MKKYRIINKTKFYVFIIFTVYFSFSALSFFRSFGRAENIRSNVEYEKVHIFKGDTIWDIALEYKSDKSDVRDVVAEIRDFNKLEDLSIKPGDIIQVPLRKR